MDNGDSSDGQNFMMLGRAFRKIYAVKMVKTIRHVRRELCSLRI